jgi:hypothetical protein
VEADLLCSLRFASWSLLCQAMSSNASAAPKAGPASLYDLGVIGRDLSEVLLRTTTSDSDSDWHGDYWLVRRKIDEPAVCILTVRRHPGARVHGGTLRHVSEQTAITHIILPIAWASAMAAFAPSAWEVPKGAVWQAIAAALATHLASVAPDGLSMTGGSTVPHMSGRGLNCTAC